MIYLLLLLPIVIAPIEAYFDVSNSKKEEIEHQLSALVRVLCSVLLSIIWLVDLIDIGLYFQMLLVIYWIVFDISNNLFYKRNWLYIGNTAMLDKLARKIVKKDFKLYLAIKINYFLLLLILFENAR